MDRGNENAGATSGGSGEFPAAPMGGFAAMMNALKAETSGTGDPDAISLASATRLKDQGNAAYKRRDFAAAAGHYGKAARVVTAATDPALLALSRNPRAPPNMADVGGTGWAGAEASAAARADAAPISARTSLVLTAAI